MIAALAALIAFFTGWVAEKNKWQYPFQANTYKHKRVISLFFLGCRVIKKKLKVLWQEFLDAFVELQNSINSITWAEEKL